MEQAAAYAAVLGEGKLVADEVEIGGPLNGLMSVHERCPEDDLLVLACDMQDIDEETILTLVDAYRIGGAEFYVYYDGEYSEPFCAVYTAAGLTRVKGKIGEERRMRAVIGMGNVRRLEIKRKEAFGNHNDK
jgi:molybdopterin-guanine dinucleotide biosynthesis protein A